MPVLDQIVVTLTEEELASGLHLPVPMEPTGPKYAKVIAVGPGRPSEYSGTMISYGRRAASVRFGDGVGYIDSDGLGHGEVQYEAVYQLVAVGQTILIHGGAGTPVKRNGVEYRFILPRDVLAVAP